MGTRAVIARKTKTGFKGVYHHWDGYPQGLGSNLWDMCKEKFKGDVEKMLKFLIDEHPGGWSTTLRKHICYCHNLNQPEAFELTENNASSSGCEWAYVFDGDKMQILASYGESGTKMIGCFGSSDPMAIWEEIEVIDFKLMKPDFESIQNIANKRDHSKEVMALIKKCDSEYGLSLEKIIRATGLNASYTEGIIMDLLKTGRIFEPRRRKFKILE